MAEYSREQRNQLSRAIANSETGSRQLKGFVDNRRNYLFTIGQSKTIQRMVRRGKYDFSSGMHFAIEHGRQARTLYSDGTFPITPLPFFENKGDIEMDIALGKPKKGGTVFTRFEPKAKLYTSHNAKYPEYDGPQDCVRYAAALVNNASDWGERYPLLHNYVSGVAGAAPVPFDYSGAGAFAAGNPSVNAHAGEMMYTTRLGYPAAPVPLGCYNFHGTSVIAVDGSEQITSEACVDSGRAKPNFMMYRNGAPLIAGQIVLQTFVQKYNPQIETPGVVPTDQVSGVVV